jgi:uncharacterized membrane protein
MNAKKLFLATAAASLFIAGPALAADEKADAKVKCEGVNACKSQSACKSAGSSCAGKNACKGKGFLMVSEEECEQLKAEGEDDGQG